MSAIANFKKRREAAKAKQQNPSNQYAASTPAPENEALTLLAYLLGCDESEAIEQAKELVELGCEVIALKARLTDKQAQELFDKSSDDAQADTLSHAIEAPQKELTDAAESVNKAANDVSEASSDLAYTAEDIGQVTSDLKEATAELKKPSAAPESSHSKKTAEPKNNSKK
jgi:hypothetical protein